MRRDFHWVETLHFCIAAPLHVPLHLTFTRNHFSHVVERNLRCAEWLGLSLTFSLSTADTVITGYQAVITMCSNLVVDYHCLWYIPSCSHSPYTPTPKVASYYKGNQRTRSKAATIENAGLVAKFLPGFTVVFFYRRLMSWPPLIAPITRPSSFTFSPPPKNTSILHMIIYYQGTKQRDRNTMPQPSEKHSVPAFNHSCGQTSFTNIQHKKLAISQGMLSFVLHMCASVILVSATDL